MVLVSCVNENTSTGYRLVGKNGRVIYLEKKRPTFNQEKLMEKQQITKQNNRVKQFNDSTNKKVIRINEDNKINENLVLESSAYSLKSVIDTMVDNKDISTLAKTVEKTQKPKTIRDFKIPESYFNSSKYVKEITINNSINNKKDKYNTKNNNDIIVLNNSTLNKNNKQQKTQKKESLFSTLFSRKKENIKSSQKSSIISNNKPEATLDIAKNNNTPIVINNNKPTNKIDDDIIKRNESIKNEFLNGSKKNNIEVVKNKNQNINNNKNINKKVNNTKNLNNNGIKNNSNFKKGQTKNKVVINDGLIKDKYYIQIGSYTNEKKAYKMVNDFNSTGNEQKVVPILFNDQQMYRVVVGAFNTKPEAEKVMEKIIEKGHFDVFVFKK